MIYFIRISFQVLTAKAENGFYKGKEKYDNLYFSQGNKTKNFTERQNNNNRLTRKQQDYQ